MRYLISIMCIALLFWGCDTTTAVPAKPKVVRKKIVAPKGKTVKVSTKKKVRTVNKKPAGKSQTKMVVAKVDQTQANEKSRPVPKKKADSRTLIAHNEKSKPVPSIKPGSKPAAKPVPDNQPGQANQKKPAFSPKADITEKKKTQPAAGKTVAGKKAKASGPTTAKAPKVAADGLPPVYNPKGKINPFEPLIREKVIIAKKKKNIRRKPRTPLERIALSQLKLTAIILAASGNRALVEETSGKGYVIKKGTYIGTNGGQIVKIQKEIVIVEEKFEDFSGKIQTRKRELKLPKPPGEF